MKELSQLKCIESRWPVTLAVVAVLALLILLPARVRVFPAWVGWALACTLVVPMVALSLSTDKSRWLHIEGIATIVFVLITGFALLYNLQFLLFQMVRGEVKLSGQTLLTSSIAVWATNVLIFSLAYWRIDRGGPEARANQINIKPDWLFPQETIPELAPVGWRPSFIDYLFLAFSTATAFSPTDTLPLTSRAKVLMMAESVLSLVTIITVLARAINILGT
jgi:hypothetical protein